MCISCVFFLPLVCRLVFHSEGTVGPVFQLTLQGLQVLELMEDVFLEPVILLQNGLEGSRIGLGRVSHPSIDVQVLVLLQDQQKGIPGVGRPVVIGRHMEATNGQGDRFNDEQDGASIKEGLVNVHHNQGQGDVSVIHLRQNLIRFGTCLVDDALNRGGGAAFQWGFF
jgi:hypothetical protein